MAKRYRIKCELCEKEHFPLFGKDPTAAVGFLRPEFITIPYTCPVSGKKGEVSYPYDDDIYRCSIVGWK